MIRESVAAALRSGLKDSPERETPLDRLTAFSGASRLGTLLWRLKYANDAKAFKPASWLVARALPRHISNSLRISVAGRALKEWCLSMCETCRGAKQIPEGDKLVDCRTCQATGKRRHTDHDRARDGINAGLTPLLGKARQVIIAHDMETANVTLQRLDRLP